MGVLCDRQGLGSTAALKYRSQNKGRYCKKELLFLLVLLLVIVFLYGSVDSVSDLCFICPGFESGNSIIIASCTRFPIFIGSLEAITVLYYHYENSLPFLDSPSLPLRVSDRQQSTTTDEPCEATLPKNELLCQLFRGLR
jgi:hypothetical protein